MVRQFVGRVVFPAGRIYLGSDDHLGISALDLFDNRRVFRQRRNGDGSEMSMLRVKTRARLLLRLFPRV